jgi:hypothetical protein
MRIDGCNWPIIILNVSFFCLIIGDTLVFIFFLKTILHSYVLVEAELSDTVHSPTAQRSILLGFFFFSQSAV